MSDETCAICLGDLDSNIITLHCHATHRFHRDCLLGWVLTQAKSSCPLCRTLLIEADVNFNVSRWEKLRVLSKFWSQPLRQGVLLGVSIYCLAHQVHDLGWSASLLHGALLGLAQQTLARPFDVPFRSSAADEVDQRWYPVRIALSATILNQLGWNITLAALLRASFHRFVSLGMKRLLSGRQVIVLDANEQGYLYRLKSNLGWTATAIRGAMAGVSAAGFVFVWAPLVEHWFAQLCDFALTHD